MVAIFLSHFSPIVSVDKTAVNNDVQNLTRTVLYRSIFKTAKVRVAASVITDCLSTRYLYYTFAAHLL